MQKAKESLKGLSPRYSRAVEAADGDGSLGGSPSAVGRKSSRGRFPRRRAKPSSELPELDKTDEEFVRDWGLTRMQEVSVVWQVAVDAHL